jgi:hypothetical protein
MSAHPKLVFSRTLNEPLSWSNARLAARDPAAEITALKQQPGAPLRCIGSVTLAREMMALGCWTASGWSSFRASSEATARSRCSAATATPISS